MKRPLSRLTAALYKYRTEGDSPLRQALAVALGLFIGASPFIGLHMALAIGLGGLFKLNRLKVYVAANISNPIVAPFLYAFEIQVGTRLRTGHFLSAATIGEVRLHGIAIDILLGSVVVGLVLAVTGAVLTYWSSGRRAADPDATALTNAAAEKYLASGIGSWELARGKLRMDPMYVQVLRDGRLPQRGTLIDLGCGQGLMLALIVTARERAREGKWPASWPTPPMSLDLRGIETRPRVAARARQALEQGAVVEEVDLTHAPLPPCHAILLFDVLHLLSRETQDFLLSEAARVMPAGGVLMIREADAAGGWKFNMVRAGNRINALVQARFSRRFEFDSVAGWVSRLRQRGFDVESVTRHDNGVFANVLIQARLLCPEGSDPQGSDPVSLAG